VEFTQLHFGALETFLEFQSIDDYLPNIWGNYSDLFNVDVVSIPDPGHFHIIYFD